MSTDSTLRRMIARHFLPGCGAYSSNIVRSLDPIPAACIRREIGRMRKEGILKYCPGYGFWVLCREVES